jgi:2'-5' RNA ligase
MNNYALVAYLPDPLRKFLDDLRRELVPGCAPHAHVTVLPPRPLSGTPEEAMQSARSRLSEFSPFELTIAGVEVFETTDVIFLAIGEGRQNLLLMHRALNAGPLEYTEPYPYHPHITLAQDLNNHQSIELKTVAARRWADYSLSRSFTVDSLVFVQNITPNVWVDLAHFQLHPAPSVRR